MPVRLVAIDEPVLARLLERAVTDAVPSEVMPPMAGPPGWTPAHREAFCALHRRNRTGPERTWAVEAVEAGAHHVVGALRLAPVPGEPHAREVGLWLGRSCRRRGTGTAAIAAAFDVARAASVQVLVARTTAGNAGALAALARNRFALSRLDAGHVVGRAEVG